MTKPKARTKAPRSAPQAAWVLSHVEFMGCTAHPRVDSLVLHVASTREGALAWARRMSTSPMGWWELHRFEFDQSEEDSGDNALIAEAFLDHRGREVEQPNVKRARATFDRERAKDIAGGVFPNGEHQCDVCHGASRAPSAAKRPSRRAKG